MNIQKNIAAKIRFAMMRRNCSLEELAREAGIYPVELISDVDACQLHDLHHLHRLHPLLRSFAETVYVEVLRMSEALDQLDTQDDSLDELLIPRPQIPDALTDTRART